MGGSCKIQGEGGLMTWILPVFGETERQAPRIVCVWNSSQILLNLILRLLSDMVTKPGRHTRVYPKVSGLAAWSENCELYNFLPLGAVVSLFMRQSSEFCHRNPLYCFSTRVYCYCYLFRYRLSPETFGYTHIWPESASPKYPSNKVKGEVFPGLSKQHAMKMCWGRR
jgi:hypothetical protein